jgi:DNA-directed RNA polymerase specialized sigma24 family protein
MGRETYRPKYVRRLVEEYSALDAHVDTTEVGLRYLVELADLHRAFARLSSEYAEVVFAHGLVQLSQEEAARVLQKSQRWVSKTYRDALEELTYLINGEDAF